MHGKLAGEAGIYNGGIRGSDRRGDNGGVIAIVASVAAVTGGVMTAAMIGGIMVAALAMVAGAAVAGTSAVAAAAFTDIIAMGEVGAHGRGAHADGVHVGGVSGRDMADADLGHAAAFALGTAIVADRAAFAAQSGRRVRG